MLKIGLRELHQHLYAPNAVSTDALRVFGDGVGAVGVVDRMPARKTSRTSSGSLAAVDASNGKKGKGPCSSLFPFKPQSDVNRLWQSPIVAYHLWTSKLAGSFLVVCILGPWAPQLFWWAFGVLGSMYVFQVFALVRLRKKDKQVGADASVAYVFFVCIACGLVSIGYFAFRDFGGGSKGAIRSAFFCLAGVALSYPMEWIAAYFNMSHIGALCTKVWS